MNEHKMKTQIERTSRIIPPEECILSEILDRHTDGFGDRFLCAYPTDWLLQSVAAGAVVEVTKRSKPSERVTLGDLASTQAGTRVNAEQASKRVVRGPTGLSDREGRSRWARRATAPSGPAGAMAPACVQMGIGRNTGSPARRWRVTTNRTPVRDRLGRVGWRRGP